MRVPRVHWSGTSAAAEENLDDPFMQLTGWAAAPTNAHAAVTQMAHYISAYEDGQGLVDILERMREFMPSLPERNQGERGQNAPSL